ncbi:MAG: hypothetical protein AAGI52_13450 [Bacteroidota bacterium]
MRFLSFALLALFLLPGCDLIESLEDSDPVAVPITSVRIADIPLMPNRTTEWDDDGTGPDVFVEIQNTAGSNLGRSAIIPDVDLTQPLTVQMPDGIETGSADARLFVAVYDDDGGNIFVAERLGDSRSFSVEELEGSGGSLVLLDSRSDNGRVATYEVIR